MKYAASRQAVFIAIESERDYQDSLWNENTTLSKGQHSIEEFLLYMMDYMAEARSQLSRKPCPKAQELAIHTMRKITAMGVSCMEQNGAPQREGFER